VLFALEDGQKRGTMNTARAAGPVPAARAGRRFDTERCRSG
jgi:hypothetical protein